MKKPYLLPFLICLLALTAISCEKDSVLIAEEALTAEERFERLAKPQILYQYSSLNLETGEESGWIIDDKGAVRPYYKPDNAFAFLVTDHETWSKTWVAQLAVRADEAIHTIPAEEMLTHYRQSRSLHEQTLSDIALQENEPVLHAFHAFVLRSADNSHNDNQCNRNGQLGSSYTTPPPQIRRIVLQLSGYAVRDLTSPGADDLMDWLQDIDSGL